MQNSYLRQLLKDKYFSTVGIRSILLQRCKNIKKNAYFFIYKETNLLVCTLPLNKQKNFYSKPKEEMKRGKIL